MHPRVYQEFERICSEKEVRGSFWFHRSAIRELLAMIDSGVLNLSPIKAHSFPLSEIEAAIKATPEISHGFDHVALTCS